MRSQTQLLVHKVSDTREQAQDADDEKQAPPSRSTAPGCRVTGDWQHLLDDGVTRRNRVVSLSLKPLVRGAQLIDRLTRRLLGIRAH
jgi:hypothetical protein